MTATPRADWTTMLAAILGGGLLFVLLAPLLGLALGSSFEDLRFGYENTMYIAAR